MIVDDSAVIRGLTKRILETNDTIEVVASVGNGEYAVRAAEQKDIDVVVLDIEMPTMDGITALPLLIKANPKLRIIMSSTLTTRNAEISLKALSLGAADYIPKPTSASELNSGDAFRQSLLEKVVALGAASHRAQGISKDVPTRPGTSSSPKAVSAGSVDISLRKAGTMVPDILAIGSSTGGPQALFEFFKGIPADWTLPIVITQHMPATFTRILADHIASVAKRPCIESKGGEVITSGHIYVAPGDYHMILEKNGAKIVTRLTQSSPENFCRPSVDPMMRSIVEIYGPRVLALILTGMGKDGLNGCEAVVAAGGTVVAQDEETSVVWGMPGAVATHGVCSAVLPLQEIAAHITNFKTRTAA
ncbi:MAG: chemotaxis-specific protein-glutamate methyltransferase CheB [Alphaproteobacteria bacterium]|nr:chemotaxis-specific protein-glutamate methyltransferase CheB [Alphaproteobacteria bacterium]